ncbi:hypothetical protein EDD85DRAFT_794115 [Armillaria nabsnona]|nr:hypothetical protein EDD85DRAFT_794115 [Armillaria nabsnona]
MQTPMPHHCHRSPSNVFRCFITSLLFIIIIPTLWIALVVKATSNSKLANIVEGGSHDSKPMNRMIYLQAKVISADILDATVVVEWFLFGDTCFLDDNVNCTSVNIFFDTNFSPSDPRHGNGPYNNDIPTDPIFTLNKTYDQFRGCFFRTELILFAYGSRYYLSAYPFDISDAINPGKFSYDTYISVFAQDLATNNSVAISLPASYGVIAGMKATTENFNDILLPQKGPLFFLKGTTWIYVTLQRSPFVIAYCVIITITYWMVTFMFGLITIGTMFFSYRQQNEILVVPIVTLFAFIQLRASMPGAPEGFGDILDFVGLLPCLFLLSIFAIGLVGIYLFVNPDDKCRPALTWRNFKSGLHGP